MQQYVIHPGKSTIVVDARSSVGPIVWEGIGPTGAFAFRVAGSDVDVSAPVSGWLELRLAALASGNRLYDAELQRRINVAHHPTARVELVDVRPGDRPGWFAARGQLRFHGVTRPLAGDLQVELVDDRTVVVMGAQLLDIRDFGLPAPTMLMLKVFPEVRVHLVIEGERVDDDPGGAAP